MERTASGRTRNLGLRCKREPRTARATIAGLLVILLVAAVGLGGNLDEWANDGTYDYASAIVVQNVSGTAAVVNITYQTPCDPTTPDYTLTVPGYGRQTVNVNDAFPGPWGSAAIVSSDAPVVAVQNYRWEELGVGTQWAANSGGVTTPSTTWYLAEGSTWGGFETWVLVQNPNPEPASVSVTYMTPGGTHSGPSFTMEPVTQTQISIADTVKDWSSITATVTSDNPVIAQMQTTWNEGTSTAASMGTPAPAHTWYLAEGNTADWSGFETWILVQNPGSTPADVSVTYIAEGSEHPGPNLTVSPMTHDKFNVADTLPDQPHFAAVVTSDQPIVAVQSITWNDEKGHDATMGVTAPSDQWVFPVAKPFSSMSTWLAVQNTGSSSTTVQISYVSDSGTYDGPDLALDPFGRDSISLPETVESSTGYSVIVNSDQPIVAVQGTYWETTYGMHRDLNFGTPFPAQTWHLPITPHAPSGMSSGLSVPSSSGSSTESGSTGSDRDGDGVPDDEDYCPDFPGSQETNGC